MTQFLVQREIKDVSFNRESSGDSTLNLALFSGYWVIQVFDKEDKLVYLKSDSHKQDLGKLSNHRLFQPQNLEQEHALAWKYHSVNVIVSCADATLVPRTYFREGLLLPYFQLNFGNKEKPDLHYNYISQLDSYLIFPKPGFSTSWRRKIHSHRQLYHVATPWLESLLSQFGQFEHPVMAIDLEDPYVRIAVLKEGRLVFFNTFHYSDDNDLLYYIAYTSEQLDFNMHKDRYYFSGTIFKNSERFKRIYRYIRYPRFQQRLENLEYSHHFNELPQHFFYNILGLPLCE